MPKSGRQRMPNQRLRQAREARNWTQLEVADALGTTKLVVGRWERGERVPRRFYWIRLCELFGKSPEELGLFVNPVEECSIQDHSEPSIPRYWNIPYHRNPFFTGRYAVLHQLHRALSQSDCLSQSYALSGLGGIGKTQTAVEYAYRFASDYTAIFWINAETFESIISSVIAIATLLDLPEKQEQEKAVAAVLLWLTNHNDWLLILDNVEDVELVKGFLPPSRRGSLLFTSRRQALDFAAQTLSLERMTPEEGLRFLLYRARLLNPTTPLDHLSSIDLACASEIVTMMDGLPLALDQAGAYIEATQCGLSDYLQLFRSSQMRLLDEQETHVDHPLPVTKTFALAFEQLERANPLAAELQTVCTFMAPEAIPEAFFLEGAAQLGPTFEVLAADQFQFQATLKALLRYSLLQRDAAGHTVTIHRLVQVVLKERLPEAVQRAWSARVISAMSKLFPSNKTQVDYWQVCCQYLSHALVCIALGEQWKTDVTERVTLICRVVTYLSNRAQFTEAEPLCQRALHLAECALGPGHPLVAEALKGLANIFFQQGKYEEAKLLCKRALYIEEQVLGPEDPQVASSLNNLAILYAQHEEYEEALPLLQRALRIWEHKKHLRITTSLHNLGACYLDLGRHQEAEPLFQRVLHSEEQVLGPFDPDLAYPLTNLGNLYRERGEYTEAESFYQRALHIREQALGAEHYLVAEPLTGLATLCRELGKYEEAELLYLRALHIWEQTQGVEHPLVAELLTELATLYRELGKYQEARALYERALFVREQAYGPEHSLLAEPLQGLAWILSEQGEYEEAKSLYQRALTLRQQRLGSQHPRVAESLHGLAHFYQMQQQTEEALSLYRRALVIREQALGADHPRTKKTRTAIAQILENMEKKRI